MSEPDQAPDHPHVPAPVAYINHADLGGQTGHGAVVPEPEDERFHAAWEPRALAVTLAMGATGAWSIDRSRSARETLPDYRSLSYYQVWISALERLLAAQGLVQDDELAAGHALRPGPVLPRRLIAADVAATLARGSPTERPAAAAPRHAVGDWVRLRAEAMPHHSRVPAYARGRLGRIERVHGCHVFAETHAQGLGEAPDWLYTVAFDGATLWGDGAAPGLVVSIDAWQSTLSPTLAGEQPHTAASARP